MNLNKISYNLDKTKDCVLIKADNWLQPESNILSIHKIKGTSYNTRITEALKVNSDKAVIEEGSKILVTSVVADIVKHVGYQLDEDEVYYDVPITQVIGTFNGSLVLDNINPILDKIILKRINASSPSLIYSKSQATIAEVLKAGNEVKHVKEGDIVLLRDNVATEFSLGTEDYLATEESAVIGIFKESNFSINSLKVINEWVLMKPYIKEKISETLYTPDINYEDLDWSDLFNRDLFQIISADESLTRLRTNDIIIIDRSVTTYAYLGDEKYFITKGMDYIECRIQGEK